MLNPSTADALQDDPTIRRCIGFAVREGCGGLKVVNLFAFRATSPEDMMMAADPHGPRNAEYLHDALSGDGPIAIAGWGAHPMAKEVGKALARRYSLNCLGVTKEGAPRHPLYIKRDAPLVPLSSGATS